MFIISSFFIIILFDNLCNMEIKKVKEIKKCTILDNMGGKLNKSCLPPDILLLDLETTGLSWQNAAVCLAGMAYLDGGRFVTEQFFAESPADEPALLRACIQLPRRFSILVTYNGAAFDLPFLYNRCKKHGIATDWIDRIDWIDWMDWMDRMEHSDNKEDAVNGVPPAAPATPGFLRHMDLYRLVSSYRHLLNLENYKQQTVEAWLGIRRTDACDGKQAAKLYRSYQKSPDDHMLEAMLLHNQNDLYGLYSLLAFCTFDQFFHGVFMPEHASCGSYRRMDGSQGKEFTIVCRVPQPFPASLSCNGSTTNLPGNGSSASTSCSSSPGIYLHCNADQAVFRVPVYEGTLKYFYPDYKDYYYLPLEDTAIHKSVAAYMDRSHRKKATAATCYTKKEGIFLPQWERLFTPALYKQYKDPVSYFALIEDFCTDTPRLKSYCMHIQSVLCRRANATHREGCR